MSKKVKVGIIGLGFMGITHFRIYQSNPKAEVVAIADVDLAKLKGDISSIITNIGDGDNSKPLPLDGIKTYTDAMDLIQDPDVELVDICAPVYMHRKYAILALKLNKHVLCEKPLGSNRDDAEAIVAASEKSNGFLMVGMCIRFWPEYKYASELIKSGKAGKVISATFKRLSPNISGNSWENWFMKADLSRGAIYDLHLHDTDIIRSFFGMPSAVTSFGVKGVRSDKGIDHVVTRYDFGDDLLVVAEGGWDASKSTPFEMSFQIVCENMTIRFSETGYKICKEDGTVETPSVADPSLPTGWHGEIDYILNGILSNKDPQDAAPLHEILDSIKIVEAEIASVNKKETVQI
jgi:predicted dehydrogenase